MKLIKPFKKKLKHAFPSIYRSYKKYNFEKQIKNSTISVHKFANIEDVGKIICEFKPATIESISILKTYDFIEKGSFNVNFPKMDFWKLNNATVFYNSDAILCDDNKIIWTKRNWFNFSKLITLDECVCKYDQNSICIRKPTVIHRINNGFSLIGVHSHIWAHAISDYYTRLSMLKKAIEDCDDKITVIMPDYDDAQLKGIVYDQLNKYPNIETLTIKNGEAVLCENLYHLDRICRFGDHAVSIAIGDSAQPKIAADILRELLVNPALQKIRKPDKKIKLFLPRHGLLRNMLNYQEVEDYFRKEGYVFIEEPHKMSFLDKVQLFNSASVIVGPYGSAFTNMFFCAPGTKVLLLNNYQRVFESSFSMYQDHFGIEIMHITGFDDKDSDTPAHCSYYIPLDKIIAAAKDFGIIDPSENQN